MYFNADDSVVKSMTGWIYNKSAKYVSQYTNVSKNEFGQYFLMDRDVLDDEIWPELIDKADSVPAVRLDTYDGIHTNMKYFTYKVYQVDPLTRENLNANRSYGGDDPLITVRYGCAPEETALKCKLPLDEVERRIKNIHPEWQGYRAGEMYRIVLEVEEQVGIGEKPLNKNGYTVFGFEGFNDFGQKLRTAKTTTSILFRCYESTECIQKDEKKYNDTDFTPIQWIEYPTNMHTIPAGQKHTVEVRNGKTGMIDWQADARVFDIYYQWWEVDEKGNELRLLAGTDNIFEDGLPKTKEFGIKNDYKAGMDEIIEAEKEANPDHKEIYDLQDKAKHKPGGWNLSYGDYQYCNTVDPDDPMAATYVNPEYPNVTGLPKVEGVGLVPWTAEQIHLYSSETTNPEDLRADKNRDLDLYNNNLFKDGTDSCYIPKEMIGKYVRVKVIALNARWPLAFDKKQTFWSHTMQVCDPNSPEGYLNIQTVEDEEFGEDVPATLSIEKQRDFYDGSKIASVTYFAYGKAKQIKFEEWKDVKMNLTSLPPVYYPKDFSDTLPKEFKENWADYNGVCAVIGLTNDYYQKIGFSNPFTEKYAYIYPAPDLYGTFTIRDNLNSDPNEKDHPATFSVTALNGLNAGETISGVDFYAYGKVKSFTDLSIYDPKDIPEARYPVGFTEIPTKPRFAQNRGEVVVRVTTSKGSEKYRTVYLTEEKPQLKGM